MLLTDSVEALQAQCREPGDISVRCLNPVCTNLVSPKLKFAPAKYYCSPECVQTVSILRRAATLLRPLGKERSWELINFILWEVIFMSAFLTLQAADARAQSGVNSRIWVSAHSILDETGRIGIRVLRFLPNSGQTGTVSDNAGTTFDSMNPAGGWDRLYDDAQT